MSGERTPLLGFINRGDGPSRGPSASRARENYTPKNRPSYDPHRQFCILVGIPYGEEDEETQYANKPRTTTLYSRVHSMYRAQSMTYYFTASLSNALLFTQVILGAALTALGGSKSPYILITLFGALNTVIAGLVAYLKSRGQPVRARAFRDDLEHVINEIEDAEIMWLGISNDAHGYDEIDIDGDDAVSVRSEVARLTRLFDRAVKSNKANNPDLYSGGQPGSENMTALRARPGGALPAGAGGPSPAVDPAAAAAASGAGAAAPAGDDDESPATAKAPDKDKEKDKDKDKDEDKAKDDKPAEASKAADAPNAAAAAADATASKDAFAAAANDEEAPATATKSNKDEDTKDEAAEDGKAKEPAKGGDNSKGKENDTANKEPNGNNKK